MTNGHGWKPLAVEGEVTFVTPASDAEADLAARAWAVQWRYAHGDAPRSDLDAFTGHVVGGRRIETNASTLDSLAVSDAFDLAEVYRELFG